MKNSNSRIKRLISCVFAFLLTLLFVILYLCAGLSFGVFNNKSITRAINDTNYYNKVYKELVSDTETLVTETGLPTTVLMEVMTQQRVYIGGMNYVDQTLRGEEADLNTDKLRSQLTDNIANYLQQQNIAESESLGTGKQELIAALETEYKNAISLPLVKDITEYKDQYHNLITIIFLIVIVLVGVMCYFLIRMHKYRHRGLRYIIYALMASSLLTIFTAFYLLITKQYARLEVTPEYYKNFLEAFLRWDIMIFIYIGGIGLTISIALTSLISYLKNGIKNN